MAKYWDWYEVEFERVAGKLPSSRKAEILDSLREHVEEAVLSIKSEGKSELDAEQEAIRQLGPPSEVVRMERDRPRNERLPVLVALIGLLWCSGWMIVGSMSWTMWNILPALWLTPPAVFLATLLGRKTKIWAIAGATAGCAVLMLAGFSFGWLNLYYAGGFGVSPRWYADSYEAEAKASIREMDTLIQDAYQADKAYKSGNDSLLMLHLRGPSGMWKTSWNSYSSSYETALKNWRLSKVIKSYRAERARRAQSLAALRDPKSFQPWRMLVDSTPSVILVALASFGVLATAHSLGMLVLWMLSMVSRRRWRRLTA